MLSGMMTGLLEPIRACRVISVIMPSTPPQMIIGTHDGSFHCDEALAIGMLLLHPTYQTSANVVRTRNPAILAVSYSFYIALDGN